jgi:hypothetical protein
MSHLTLETLARLVDEEPAGTEAAHLAVCEACLGELHELRADAAALASLPDLMPPPRAWHALEARLGEEGLVRGTVVGGAAAAAARRRWFRVATQLAAAVALVGLGTGIGAFALAPRLAPAASAAPVAVAPAANGGAEQVRTAPVTQNQPQPQPAASDAAAGAGERPEQAPQLSPRTVGPRPGTRLVAHDLTPRLPASAEEALLFMREAESAYLEALTRYAELAGGVPGGDPMARLAALEGIVLTTRAALGQAPADPVINGYHMTALAQREATLRQIAGNPTQIW